MKVDVGCSLNFRNNKILSVKKNLEWSATDGDVLQFKSKRRSSVATRIVEEGRLVGKTTAAFQAWRLQQALKGAPAKSKSAKK